MADCIFCKIIDKSIPADIIYEDKDVLAFLDLRPANKGHTLVVPKMHSTDLLNTDNEVLMTTIVKVKKIALGVMEALGAEGFNLGVNTKEAAGQVVFHLHFHIIPRYNKDGLKLWPQKDLEPKSRAELAEKIKSHIK